MSQGADQARVSMAVRGTPERVFAAFTEEIDTWWRRGPRFRNTPGDQGIICLEPRVGGRVFESYSAEGAETVIEMGRISCWEPPQVLCFSWRLANFSSAEQTEVEITFVKNGTSTMVTVIHRGWDKIRADHPARHGEDNGRFLGRLGLWWADQLRGLDQNLD